MTMHLYELAHALPPGTCSGGVPTWTLGCFRRRCITFYDGSEDTTTDVLWLQSRGLTADFRRAAGTPKATSWSALERLTPAARMALARVEGGLSRTHWDGRHMSWTGWESFQNHDKWPEAGRLERVGGCLIEHAPSGAYIEDWRVVPCGAGPLIGLQLIDERDLDTGSVRHRGGGLIVCGQHAAFVRGRPAPLPEGARLETLVGEQTTPELLAAVFACDAAFASGAGGSNGTAASFVVTHATRPWREGTPLVSLEGFEVAQPRGQLLQRVEEDGRRLERRFSVDTLQPMFASEAATPVSPEGRAWHAREWPSDRAIAPERR